MQILYEDKRIVIVIKPSGIISTDVPGGMPGLLKAQLNCSCIRNVHRLDAKVSGVMVFAKSVKAASILSDQIRNHIFQKTYLAVVHGHPPLTGCFKDRMIYDRNARKAHIVKDDGPYQDAVLSYEVIDTKDDLSLVRIQLHTGRTHQIRLQFSAHGYPLFGDQKYGFLEDMADIALWSYLIEFVHPEANEKMQFSLRPTGPVWERFSFEK